MFELIIIKLFRKYFRDEFFDEIVLDFSFSEILQN